MILLLNFIYLLISGYFEDLEDIYKADKTLAELRSNKTYTIPLEEVMDEYQLKTS